MTTADPTPEPRPSQATQTPADDAPVARLALELGLLKPEQLEAGLRTQAEERARGEDAPLCPILVRQGALTTDDLVRLLREQTQRAGGAPRIPRYDVQTRLGEGATAIVYRAWDRELKRPVALKALRETAGLSEIARQRFRREAQAAASLGHPNVVTVYDAGEADGRLYLVLELVEGRPLSDVMSGPPAGAGDLARLLEKAARGVAAAHAKGIVHRDLKPQNILVTASGEPKVGDFGLAHLVDSTLELTRTGATLGTPLYMAPEQVEGRSRDVSPRSDVWALGAVLYQILAGAPPFTGQTQMEIYGKIVRQDPALPSPSAAPRDLQTIALKALEKDPGRRYPTAAEFADDLRRFLDGEPISARPLSALGRARRRIARHRARVLAAAVAAAILAGAAAWASYVSRRQADTVRRTLARAGESERAARLTEARDAYRVVLELDPRNAAARAGLERAEGELARRPAAGPARPTLLKASGRVVAIVNGERTPAETGQPLLSGQELETVGPESYAFVRYDPSLTLELDGDTLARPWTEDPAAEAPRLLTVARGAVRVSAAAGGAGKPLRVSTPDLEFAASPSTFRLLVTDDATRLVVDEGSLLVTRRLDGRPFAVESGFGWECARDRASRPAPAGARGGKLLADFESHALRDWVGATESPRCSLRKRLTSPGLQGKAALQLDYATPAGQMVWLSRVFPEEQDWTGFTHLSFWFRGSNTRNRFILEVQENRNVDAGHFEHERWNFEFRDEFPGWRRVVVPWDKFRRREFPNTPNDGFTRKEVKGVCLIAWHSGRDQSGSCGLDQVELLREPDRPPEEAWRAIFDGRSLDWLPRECQDAWRLEDGALAANPAATVSQAAQTTEMFGDGEIRIRFEVKNATTLYFAVRQGPKGRYAAYWRGPALEELRGAVHELVFVCRGDSVSATLDGELVPLENHGSPREGSVQFNATAPGLRVYSLEVRPLR
jgi:serine/threonine-protein kinase